MYCKRISSTAIKVDNHSIFKVYFSKIKLRNDIYFSRDSARLSTLITYSCLVGVCRAHEALRYVLVFLLREWQANMPPKGEPWPMIAVGHERRLSPDHRMHPRFVGR